VQGNLRLYTLGWSNAGPDGKPARRVDIHRNIPQGLPLVLRSAPVGNIWGTNVAPNVCYLTDERTS
jgi:hypothetical protein